MVVPEGQFPGASRVSKGAKPYCENELKQIIAAVKADLDLLEEGLERPYQRKYLNQPPPIEDVAPYDESLSFKRHHSRWASREYQVWWWENNCKCRCLNVREISNLSKGESFLRALSGLWNLKESSLIGASERLADFYEGIGASKNYIPRYLDKSCPIKYFNRWDKFEYLHWYWENKCDCMVGTFEVVKRNHPVFANAIKEHYGSIVDFFNRVGITRVVHARDLIPYYVGLLVSTALNPSTIRNLEIDCLTSDSIDSKKFSINWTKLRARKQGKTIPINKLNGLSPIVLIERLISATRAIRGDAQRKLFITNGSNSGSTSGHALSKTVMARALNTWFRDHQIKDTSLSLSSSELTKGTSARFRPTIAQREYVRTGELSYVQTLLSHSRSELTSEYIHKVSDPVLRFRRGIHIEAVLVGAIEGREAAKELVERAGVTVGSRRVRNVAARNLQESEIAHCREPRDSPVHGQRKGEICDSYRFCLYCPNLVVTEEDLWRHFAFVFYHQKLLEKGEIDVIEFQENVGERNHIFENYIFPRYSPLTIQEARGKAMTSPPIEWATEEDDKDR